MIESSDAATIEVDPDGTIVHWDAAAERLWGRSAANALSRSTGEVLGDAIAELVQRTRIEGPLMLDCALGPAGEATPVTIVARPIGSAGAVQLTLFARRLPEQTLQAARRLAAIVESSDDAIVSKDLNGVVQTWNRAAERIFGYSADEMVGSSIRRIIPDERQGEEDATLATIRRGEKVDHFETVRQRKSGERVPISLTVSPILDEAGRIVGASKIARDISALRQAEADRIRLLEETVAITETLNEVGAAVASDLDRESMVKAVTDAATELTGAEFGAFEATFSGTGAVRSPDVTQDSRYAHDPSSPRLPGEPRVRSYLAVPVRARTGEVIGGLHFGHSGADRFTAQHERLALGIASWASVALENARLYEGAQEASRLKDDFLASLSHELRTPLHAILGYVRIVRSGIIGPDDFPKALETIERNANALAQIVEDVLDVSRIISGKLRLNVQTVDLSDAVGAAIDAVTPAADARAVRIATVIDPRVAPISGDPDRLQQVLWNLLSNAVKFSTRGGHVEVGLAAIDDHVEITVRDTGIGIPPEFLPHIFERFRQADGGTTRGSGGLGLGLAISKQLVEMHGGTIAAESAGRGTGATLRVRFPVSPPLPAADRRAQSPTNRATVETRLPDLAGLHVLAVDDEKDALALVGDVLEAVGARVTKATSVSEALSSMEVSPPDVLIADLGMPMTDGFALIQLVRGHANAAIRDLPAAALTAYARSEDRMKALRAGFDIHLAKPIEPSELTTTVASLAARFRGRA